MLKSKMIYLAMKQHKESHVSDVCGFVSVGNLEQQGRENWEISEY